MADLAGAPADILPLRPGETWEDRMAVLHREEQADHEAADAMLAEQRAAAEAEADADLAREEAEIADRLQSGEPPDGIDVDTADLPPMRARLVRYGAWLDGKRVALERAKQARPHLVATKGKPAATEARRVALKAEDEAALLAWALAKVADPEFAEPRPVARSFEAEQIRQQHAGDEHAATVALEALGTLDRAIAKLTAEIPALEARHHEFIQDAVDEHAGITLGERYAATIAELAVIARDLNGQRVAAGKFALKIDHDLPAFDVPGVAGHSDGGPVDMNAPRKPALKVSEAVSRAAAAPWKALAQRWRDDPRANPEMEASLCR